jgi:hypothetical protein
VAEIRHRARRGANRPGREKRRRRTEAGVEPRDEARAGRSARQRAVRVASAGKWILRAGSVVGAANLRGGRPGGRDGLRADLDERTGQGTRSSRVNARPWVEARREGKPTRRRSSGRRQGPHRKVQRTQVEPRSQTSSYARPPYAEGQRNTAEGQAAPERDWRGQEARSRGNPRQDPRARPPRDRRGHERRRHLGAAPRKARENGEARSGRPDRSKPRGR